MQYIIYYIIHTYNYIYVIHVKCVEQMELSRFYFDDCSYE